MATDKSQPQELDKGWRKAAVTMAGILALCYGVYPKIGAIDGAQWYYGVLLLAGGYAGINMYSKLKLVSPKSK